MIRVGRQGALLRFGRVFRRDKYLYALSALPVLYYLLFHYLPMYGVLIAFKNIKVFSGLGSILRAPGVGFRYFEMYLSDPYFWKLVRNTILIRVLEILWGFPAPILLALLLNEIKNAVFRRSIQSVTYLPHFISTVVICGMVTTFLETGGLVNEIIRGLGGTPIQFLARPEWFRTVY